MSESIRARMMVAACVTALALAACGGGGGGSASTVEPVPVGTTPPVSTTPTNPDPLTPPAPVSPDTPTPPGASGAPLATGNIAADGREWINYRRGLIGMSTLVRSNLIDIAAQGHSDYQRINNTITHDQTPGKEGFTGVDVSARLATAGYHFNTSASRAYGEVISATSNGSGQYMAEELITAIYHRFVIFEPVFKEIGTGAATTSAGCAGRMSANPASSRLWPSSAIRPETRPIWPPSVPRRRSSATPSPRQPPISAASSTAMSGCVACASGGWIRR